MDKTIKYYLDQSDEEYYLDQSDEGYFLIKDQSGNRYTAGFDKEKVSALIDKLNKSHRPNLVQGELHEIYVCWNNHEKHEDCEYVQELIPNYKQTALEWFMSAIAGDIVTPYGPRLKYIIEKGKSMERAQIQDAWLDGKKHNSDFCNYYEEKYGKESRA